MDFENFENIDPKLREKALACKDTEELAALAKAEGVELTDEQLEAIAGGAWYTCSQNKHTW